ncbi:glycosyl transferase family protein [Paraglaciecola marina]|uniref:glycosyl transferase family protein n=1 Tax=Paraglaciecola marina TaxID=2500157 RepID=UPI00105D49FA|nr:glycosyl transferase family protein [Paraglaciecola marina]
MTNTEVKFKDFIRIIGRGQRAGRTLTQSEAKQAMSMLINGEATPEQQGAFLMLLRVREETAEELAGFTEAFRGYNSESLQLLSIDLDMGCYAGKRRHLPWFLLAAMLLGQNGKRVFLHGTHEPDSKRLYLKEVLPQLGFDISENSEQARAGLNAFGFAYMDLRSINPQLDRIIQLRDLFGLRSCANTLARLLNPSNATNSLQGIFHRKVDEKHQETAALLEDKNTLCFRGEGGELEFNPLRDVTLFINRGTAKFTVEIPNTLDTYVTKPKELDPLYLVSVWTGQTKDDYAEHALLGTLASMLILVDKLDSVAAYAKASRMWETRVKVWPVTLPNIKNNVVTFDTSGKHYAH